MLSADLQGFNFNSDFRFNIVPGSAVWGESVEVQIAVANLGSSNANAGSPFDIDLFLSSNSSIDDGADLLLGRFGGLSVPDRNSITGGSINIPLPQTPFGGDGTYYIGLVVDSSNDIPESNESNNKNQGNLIDRDSLTINSPIPDIEVDATSLDFGEVVDDGVSDSLVTRTFTITNQGTDAFGPLTIDAGGLSFSDGTHFRLGEVLSSRGGGSAVGLPSNIDSRGEESWLVEVVFDPSTTGGIADTLLIDSNDPNEPQLAIPLMGVGVPLPNVVFTDQVGLPTDLLVDFGDVAADGAVGEVRSTVVSLQNDGSGPLVVEQNGLFLVGDAAFSVASVTSSTQGLIDLTAGPASVAERSTETWEIEVVFDPAGSGMLDAGLRIISDDPDEDDLTVSLLGRGRTLPSLRVRDSSGQEDDGSLSFGAVQAEGTGGQLATETLSLTNTGELPLVVSQNGLVFSDGTHFKFGSISSDKSGKIDLQSGDVALAPNETETWTVELLYDPVSAGSHAESLSIQSDAPGSPFIVGIDGLGLDEADLALVENSGQANDDLLEFDASLNDGPLGERSTIVVELLNQGAQPLVVAPNGMSFADGTHFAIASVTSSVTGAIDLSAGSAEIAPASTETWTVEIAFDPSQNGEQLDQMQIASNDADTPLYAVALAGDGVQPQLMLTAPAEHISASSRRAYEIRWEDVYEPGDADISLFYDTDTDPSAGLVEIASDISEDSHHDSYLWAAPETLIGSTVYIYALIEAEGVSNESYSAGSLDINPVGTHRQLSAPVVDDPNYTLRYEFEGATVEADFLLTPGENTLFHTTNGSGGQATHEFRVELVPTLVDSESYEYDELGNLLAVTDSSGNRNEYTYDDLSRLIRIDSADGAVTEFSYDATGSLLTMHDETGFQLYAYDALDRLTSVTYSTDELPDGPGDLKISYEYDLADQLTAIVYPSGKRVEYGYDVAGRLTAVTEVVNDGPNLVTNYEYDATTGLLMKATLPNDVETFYAYDDSGRLLSIAHRRSSDASLMLRYEYTLDASGRNTQVVVSTPNGVRAEAYSYDPFGRLEQAVYSDSDGVIDPSDRVVSYSYDGNGNRLSEAIDADGSGPANADIYFYEYGYENRLSRVMNQSGEPVTEYFYDARGNTVLEVNGEDTRHFEYDSLGRLLSVTGSDFIVAYAYDGAGRRLVERTGDETTRLVVDPSNPIYQIIEERGGSGGVTRDYLYGLTRISGQLDGNGSSSFYLLDAIGSTGAIASATGSLARTYQYDAFGAMRTLPGSDTNPFRFVGERQDVSTGLMHLRARDLDTATGRFITKDPAGFPDGPNQYLYVQADPINNADPTGEFAQAAFGAAVGAAVGIGGQLISDVVGGNGFDFENLAGAAVGGAVSGAIIASTGQITAGLAAGAATKDATTQFLDIAFDPNKNSFDVGQFAVNTVVDTTVGRFVPAKFPVKVPGITKGQNSFTAIRDSTITKLGNNTIPLGSVSASTFNKSVAGSLVEGSLAIGVGTALSPAKAGLASTVNDIGGVLLDRSAAFVGTSIAEISGASFDPATNQLVFLGEDDPVALEGINADLFYTAIQSVYGSAVPPFVTLEPSGKLIEQTFDIGSGAGVIPNGQLAPIRINYQPFWATQSDDMELSFKVNGVPVTAEIDAKVFDGTGGYGDWLAGGRRPVVLELGSVDGLPSGVSLLPPEFPGTLLGTVRSGSITLSGGAGYTLTANATGQNSNFFFTVVNESGASQTITDISLKTDLQHRKFGGRVENTELGWIIYEADRIAKSLAIGKENLTDTVYDRNTPGLPDGFRNNLERKVDAGESGGTSSSRIWLQPNDITLKRFIDPETGQATVVFDEASVVLNTESLILGVSEDPQLREFVEFFNDNYDAFADIEFPVQSPDDPTGETINNVKIFDELRDAMKAVSLARFFRDNDVPIDTWWLNSYEAPTAYIPETIPTLTNTVSDGSISFTAFGGVTINLPNEYLPDAVARSIASQVMSQRPDVPGDIEGQVWEVSGTAMGTFDAVAASLDADEQDANVKLAATDLSFASPGDQTLNFDRFYDSGFLGSGSLGRGWQSTRYELQFQYPSWHDEFSLFRDSSGEPIDSFGINSDTRLRSGEVRFLDHATGQVLQFGSSLSLQYDLDNQGNPVSIISGLSGDGIPTFSPGVFQDGSTLTQDDGSRSYTLTRPDGSEFRFNAEGEVRSTTDRLGYRINYNYDEGLLTEISDDAGQAITIEYDLDGRVQFVSAPEDTLPASRRIQYVYDANGRLERVDTQSHQGGGVFATASSVSYEYNADDQLVSFTGPDGLRSLATLPDLRGRSSMREDVLGNQSEFHFELDPLSGERITETVDMGGLLGSSPFEHGIGAIQYFSSGSATRDVFDGSDRVTASTDPLGNTTRLGYDAGSIYPNEVMLPTPDRAAISVERDVFGLPMSITDPANVMGTPIQFEYNAANLPTRTIDAEGRITDTAYSSDFNVESTTRGVGTAFESRTAFSYNFDGFLETIENPLQDVVATYEYDAIGRVSKITDGTGVETRYVYDALGRLTRVHDPRLTGPTDFIEYAYNDNDQVTSITSPNGVVSYTYDPATLRLVSTTDENGVTTEYSYASDTGQLIGVTEVSDSGASTTQYVYDRLGNLALLAAPEGTRTAFRYDAAGRLTAVIDDDGLAADATTFALGQGANNRQVEVVASEPILVATLTYWLDGETEAEGVSSELRLSDETQFAFSLDELVDDQLYHYAVELTDRVGLTSLFTGGQFDTSVLEEDFNLDGSVDAADYTVWRRNLGTVYSAGDADGDLDVDEDDYAIWRGNYGALASSADFNRDGVTDAADYTVWRDNLGADYSSTSNAGDATGDLVVDDQDYLAWKTAFGDSIINVSAVMTSVTNSLAEAQQFRLPPGHLLNNTSTLPSETGKDDEHPIEQRSPDKTIAAGVADRFQPALGNAELSISSSRVNVFQSIRSVALIDSPADAIIAFAYSQLAEVLSKRLTVRDAAFTVSEYDFQRVSRATIDGLLLLESTASTPHREEVEHSDEAYVHFSDEALSKEAALASFWRSADLKSVFDW